MNATTLALGIAAAYLFYRMATNKSSESSTPLELEVNFDRYTTPFGAANGFVQHGTMQLTNVSDKPLTVDNLVVSTANLKQSTQSGKLIEGYEPAISIIYNGKRLSEFPITIDAHSTETFNLQVTIVFFEPKENPFATSLHLQEKPLALNMEVLVSVGGESYKCIADVPFSDTTV